MFVVEWPRVVLCCGVVFVGAMERGGSSPPRYQAVAIANSGEYQLCDLGAWGVLGGVAARAGPPPRTIHPAMWQAGSQWGRDR